ncbi:MAG: hypothetical protein AAGU32_16420, partial [Bacillota bacterium]
AVPTETALRLKPVQTERVPVENRPKDTAGPVMAAFGIANSVAPPIASEEANSPGLAPKISAD